MVKRPIPKHSSKLIMTPEHIVSVVDLPRPVYFHLCITVLLGRLTLITWNIGARWGNDPDLTKPPMADWESPAQPCSHAATKPFLHGHITHQATLLMIASQLHASIPHAKLFVQVSHWWNLKGAVLHKTHFFERYIMVWWCFFHPCLRNP